CDPMLNPSGAWTRASASAGTPFAIRSSKIIRTFRLLPIIPTYPHAVPARWYSASSSWLCPRVRITANVEGVSDGARSRRVGPIGEVRDGRSRGVEQVAVADRQARGVAYHDRLGKPAARFREVVKLLVILGGAGGRVASRDRVREDGHPAATDQAVVPPVIVV